MEGTVETSEYNGWQIVALCGDIAEQAAADLQSLVHDYIASDRLDVALDLVEAEAVTGAAIGTIVDARRWLVTLGGHLEVCGAAGPTAAALEAAAEVSIKRLSLAETIAVPPMRGPVADDVWMGFAADARSATSARRHLSRVLRSWRQNNLLDPVLLAANELITNAIVHARAPFEVRARRDGQSVRVDVRDTSFRDVSTSPMADTTDAGGRGIAIVRRLADRFGVDDLDDGKSVWFEIENHD